MSFTRFHDDPARIAKYAQQTSDPCRYIMNAPGNGSNPHFMDDPNIRMQGWGANLRTNSVNLENDLRGMTRNLNHSTLKDDYKLHAVESKSVSYPTQKAYVEESRTTHPAYMLRSVEIPRFDYLPIDPQANVCFKFQNNLDTSILKRDNFNSNPQSFKYM